MHAKLHVGGCLCGAVRYEVRGDPVVVAHCHCEKCRRVSGAGHSTGGMFAAADLSVSGQTKTFEYDSDVGTVVQKVFCPRCGSPLFGKNSGSLDKVTIMLGSMDDASDLVPSVAIFTSEQQAWDAMTVEGDLQCFEGQPEWRPPD